MNIKAGAFTLSSAILLAGTLAANAALAPNYQRARELTEIINLAAAEFPEKPIEKVIHQSENVYRVVFEGCSVAAHIVPQESKPTEPPILGPLQFSVKFEKLTCDN